ncbi:MAG: hypothetical protein LUF32_01950 [Clostridiales bacterium]|nr:hypothetical protein [Clostridiales bacterium]
MAVWVFPLSGERENTDKIFQNEQGLLCPCHNNRYRVAEQIRFRHIYVLLWVAAQAQGLCHFYMHRGA